MNTQQLARLGESLEEVTGYLGIKREYRRAKAAAGDVIEQRGRDGALKDAVRASMDAVMDALVAAESKTGASGSPTAGTSGTVVLGPLTR
jgi:hypothetical protein